MKELETYRAINDARRQSEELAEAYRSAKHAIPEEPAMPLYRKKPVVIEAMQWTGDNTRAVAEWAHPGVEPYGLPPGWWLKQPDDGSFRLVISTGDGVREVWPGDWIIRGDDEFRALKPWMFEATYELEVGSEPLATPQKEPDHG